MPRTPISAFSTPFKSQSSTQQSETPSCDNEGQRRDILSGLSQDLTFGLFTSTCTPTLVSFGKEMLPPEAMQQKPKLVKTDPSGKTTATYTRKIKKSRMEVQSDEINEGLNDVSSVQLRQTSSQARCKDIQARKASTSKSKKQPTEKTKLRKRIASGKMAKSTIAQSIQDIGSAEKTRTKCSSFEFELSPQSQRKFIMLKQTKSCKNRIKHNLLMLIARTKLEMKMLRQKQRQLASGSLRVTPKEGTEMRREDGAIQVTVSSADKQITLRQQYKLKPGSRASTRSEVPRFVDHRHIPVPMGVSEI